MAIVAASALALSLVAAVPRTATAIELGQWQHNPATGHFYAWVSYLPWDQAEAFAVSVGGHLVTINDQAEQDWLAATFTEADLWIGFNDRDVEGTWLWSSGEPVTYENWCPGQPDDWQEVGGEDFGFMNASWCGGAGWDDADGGPMAGIIEVARRPQGPIAAAPAGVNSFVGNFDIGVAHVVASFKEPTEKQLVPGNVAIYWAPDSHGAVRESHAQVLEAWFWDGVSMDQGYDQLARVLGVLCDYTGPQAGSCEPFAMAFVRNVAPAGPDMVGFSVPGSTVCCDGDWYEVVKGSFTLRYVYDTPAGS